MVKTQFLIVFLMFNIPNSFCRNFLEAEESIVELGLYKRLLYGYHETYGAYSSCWGMIMGGRQNEYQVQPFIENETCKGEITYCVWSGNTTACASTVGRSKIRWVKATQDGSLYTYGQSDPSDACPKEKALAMYRTAQGRSICLCDCFQSNWGIHLGLMQSRESDNYVITGIRFILRDNVLYLQPAEGKLEPDRRTSGSTWIPLPLDPLEIRRVDTISANIFFDDLFLDNGYVLTGVKFEYMEAPNPKIVKGFGIAVRGRPYFDSGALDLTSRSTLTIKPKTSTERYLEPNLPSVTDLMAKRISELSPETHEYVKLQQSDKPIDYGETTLPLFHNPRVTDSREPLSGFGIFHEVSKSGERFIGLRFHAAKEMRNSVNLNEKKSV